MLRTSLIVASTALLLSTGCAKKTPVVQQPTSNTCVDCETQLDSANQKVAQLEASGDLANRRLQAYRDIAKKFRDAFAGGDLEIILRNGRLVVQLPNKILFDLGKATLKPEGEEVTKKVAAVLAQIPGRSFLIAGHTDNVPVAKKSKKFTSNWQLSSLRAIAVVQLLQQEGVTPNQLAAAGYGEFLPSDSNESEEGRAENRRTEIIIMPTIDEIPSLPDTL